MLREVSETNFRQNGKSIICNLFLTKSVPEKCLKLLCVVLTKSESNRDHKKCLCVVRRNRDLIRTRKMATCGTDKIGSTVKALLTRGYKLLLFTELLREGNGHQAREII
jgi:hypothetical protein